MASSRGRGDEVKLDPNTRSLINAACAQMTANSSKPRLSASPVAFDELAHGLLSVQTKHTGLRHDSLLSSGTYQMPS